MGYANPLLKLPAGRALMALPREQREPLEQVLRELREQANVEAEKAWAKRKGPMAAYWRAVSTYARHLAHALSRPGAGNPHRRPVACGTVVERRGTAGSVEQVSSETD